MLNEEDLQKIQAIITASATSLKADLIARQDRAVESTVANISDLRQEMNRRFDRADQRFDAIERRAERLEVHMQSLILQTGGMNKSLTDAERIDSQFAATQSAQQRAIDELYTQLAEIKRRLPQPDR